MMDDVVSDLIFFPYVIIVITNCICYAGIETEEAHSTQFLDVLGSEIIVNYIHKSPSFLFCHTHQVIR